MLPVCSSQVESLSAAHFHLFTHMVWRQTAPNEKSVCSPAHVKARFFAFFLRDMTSRLFARQTFRLPSHQPPERRGHLSSTSTFALRIQDSQPIHQIQPRHNSHASKGYQKRGVQERGEGAYQDSSGELDSNPALQSVAYVALIY